MGGLPSSSLPLCCLLLPFIATNTRIFKVLLVGESRDKVEALGVRHLNTSEFNPNHIIFKQLGFMPGEAPLCHFFPLKNLMWVPQHTTTSPPPCEKDKVLCCLRSKYVCNMQ
ncbi:hypothetical protein HN51_034304 [Arachis hypogaea]